MKLRNLIGIFSLLFIVVVGAFVLLSSRDASSTQTNLPSDVISPTANATYTRGDTMSIKWSEGSNSSDPFILVSIQDLNGEIVGFIETKKVSSTSYTWDTRTYATGDILQLIDKGQYRLKIVGYKERFCSNGECAPGSKTTGERLFELLTPYFVLN